MRSNCTIQLFDDGRWHDAASIDLRGPPEHGIRTATYAAYTLDYALDQFGRRDAAAVAWSFPVQLDGVACPTWPAFLVDLLPQGYGRAELLGQLGMSATSTSAADWPLLLAGAGNPIGHLRVKEARAWLDERSAGPRRGFTDAEVAARSDDFAEYLASHGLFVAGSSGVQGEWPKILLTEGRDGLLYLDPTLADTEAARHWLVKFGRGPDPALAAILRQEAPYMRLAKRLGLRVHGDLVLRERALFVPRFDREVVGGMVVRHAQESLASLCEIAEFGAAPSHNAAVARLALAVSDPEQEITEYVRRDLANVLLGNKDNHARNTAVQRHADGTIRLTPVFDFAPMLLHPDGIARRMRWERDDAGMPRWASVVTQCREATGLPLAGLPQALAALAPVVAALPAAALEEGIDPELVARQEHLIADAVAQLAAP